MARCQCTGSSCSCAIQAGPGMQVTGVGSANQPYVLSAPPKYYVHNFNPGDPVYYINSAQVTDVGTRAIFVGDIADSYQAMIYMPDGSINAPYPILGAEVEFILSGTIGGSSTINWAGGVITWHGVPPSTTQMGWYRFVFLGNRWAGVFLGASYVP